MSDISKPFKSGKCQVCHSRENLKDKKLCDACETYSSQDYVGRDELPLDDRALDRRSFKPLTADQPEDDLKAKILKLPKIGVLLQQAKLSKQQIKIVKLNFINQMTFEQISSKLRISKASIQKQMERSLKKLQFCHTKTRSVRGKNSHESILENLYASIDPHLYYAKCPKCGSLDLQGKSNKGICLGCGWTFSVYSVEEFQNSYRYPDKPILDGSKY